jgi:hypothetical protein
VSAGVHRCRWRLLLTWLLGSSLVPAPPTHWESAGLSALEERWQASLLARAQIAPRSSVHLWDELLATQQAPKATIGHRLKAGLVQIQTTSVSPRGPTC